MQQDAEELKKFLQIYPNIQNCTIQYFMDGGREGKAGIEKMPEMKVGGWSHISELNLQGYGIFFSVNSMIEGKRNKDSVTHINAWVMENDEDSKEEQLSNLKTAPLPPSLVIESKKSLHAYWFAKDGTVENWNKICWGLRNYFNGDKQIIDISRVLRVPGFLHCKDLDDPFLCKIIGGNNTFYTESEMLSSFRDTMSDTEKLEKIYKLNEVIKRGKKSNASNEDNFWSKASELDNEMMLEKLSGTEYVGYDDITFKHNSNGSKQIVCNGKSTGCRLDKEGMIGSKDRGGPTRIQRVTWYGGSATDWKGIYKFLYDEFPELKMKNKNNKNINTKKSIENKNGGDIAEGKTEDVDELTNYTTDENTEVKTDLITALPITRGIEGIDNTIGMIQYGELAIFTGRAGSGKTEYCFFMARKNADRGEKTAFITLEMPRDKLISRTVRKRLGISIKEWNKKGFDEELKEKFREEEKKLGSYKNLSIFTTDNRKLEAITKLIQDKYQEGVRLFFIDNLGFILGNDGENEFETQARIIREIKTLTNELRITIVLLHHQKKGDGKTTDNYILTRGSGKILDDADWCMTIKREEQYSALSCFKNRENGVCPNICLEFVKGEFVLMEGECVDYEEIEKEKKKEVVYPF